MENSPWLIYQGEFFLIFTLILCDLIFMYNSNKKIMNDVKFILVHYIDIRNVAKEDVRLHVENMKHEIMQNEKLSGQILYFIPVMDDTRVECIYSKSVCNCK